MNIKTNNGNATGVRICPPDERFQAWHKMTELNEHDEVRAAMAEWMIDNLGSDVVGGAKAWTNLVMIARDFEVLARVHRMLGRALPETLKERGVRVRMMLRMAETAMGEEVMNKMRGCL